MKIDVVYTWVDGNDPEWKKKKARVSRQYEQTVSEDASCDARWMDNQELRFSLRSLNDFAPWVNNIFIVTDDQIPEWLNTEHPRIHIVDHKDIFPKDANLPTFNSMAIETRLHHIEGLSEHFLYFNDDVFLGNKTNPTYFFGKTGKPVVFVTQPIFPIPYKKLLDVSFRDPGSSNEHQHSMINNRNVMLRYFGKTSYYNLRHGVKSLLKSDLHELEIALGEDYSKTSNSQFRDNSNILLPNMSSLFSVVRGRSKTKFIRALKRKKRLSDFFYKKAYSYGYLFVTLETDSVDLWVKRLFYFRPFMFCMNQYDSTHKETLEKAARFLDSYFPVPCPFEK